MDSATCKAALSATLTSCGISKPAAHKLLHFCVCLVTLFCSFATTAFAQYSLCAEVKIEIKQKVSLERQAFDAVMKINNGLDASSLTGISINLTFQDANGSPVVATTDANNTAATFFLRLDSLDGVGAIDGSGAVAPKTSGTVKWLIIPSAGAGGLLPGGRTYRIGGTLTYTLEGETKTVTVSPETIAVKPQPQLILDYFLAGDVYADDAFTSEVEPSVPFTFGVRIKNVGGGAANKLKIETVQPTIVDNQQGLVIAFQIINGYVNDVASDKTLLLNFGDIPSSSTKTGRWDMTTTLSGRFTELASTFTHDDSLGGTLTSLLKEVNTYILVRDIKVDLPGRDNIRDFLALDGTTLKVFESEGQNTAVTDYSAGATLTSSTGGNYRLRFNAAAGLAYVKIADPNNGAVRPGRITRSDGKVLPVENIWLSKKRNSDLSWAYSVNFFDANSTGDYTVDLLPVDQLASLSGQVFVDGNNNGTRDGGEPALGLVRIDLQGTGTSNASVAVSATSDNNGAFTFSQLLPGTYRMTVASISGYADGKNTAGSAGGVVSANVISAISITAGMSATGYRFAKRTQVANAADLVSSLNAGSSVIVQGNNATITAKVKNVGPATGTNARATIVLPTGLTFVSAVPTAGTYNYVTGVWTLGDIVKDAEPTLTVTARVDNYKAYNLSIVVTSDTPDPVAGNNSAMTTLNPVALQHSDIRVLVTPTVAAASAGSSVSYVIDVSNFGPDAASTLSLAIAVPANLVAISVSASSGSFTNGVWNIDEIASLRAASLIIRGNLVDASAASVTATLNSIQSTDAILSNNSATGSINLAAPSSDVAISMAASKLTIIANETANLTIGLTNAGPSVAAGTTVNLVIPAELAVVSSTPSVGTFDHATGAWAVGNIAPGATPSLLLGVRSQTGASSLVVARAASEVAEPTLSNNEAQLMFNRVRGDADIAITQQSDKPVIALGQLVTLSTIVTNNGPVAANNLRIVGVLPEGLNAASTVATRGIYDGVAGIWTIPSLGVDEVVTLDLTTLAPHGIMRTIVGVSEMADAVPANNVSTLSLPTATTPGAPTIGTATAGNAQASVTFTAPVSNGGSAITGYTVTSSPGGLTATGTASPITVSGLTNGTAYTFTVRATNSVGTGPASAASNSVTPAAVVNAPVLVTTTLPNGVRGTAYASHLIIASTLPLTSASATGLPPGLTAVHNGSGVLTITGTPTEAGIFTLNVAATDNAGGTLATTVSLSIIADDPNTNVTALAGGGTHSCAVVDGGVQCWGWNGYGQLGDGSTTNSATPVQVSGLTSGVTAVATGDLHSCAVVNGGVRCWGYNLYGQLGNGSSGFQSMTNPTPVQVSGLPSGSGVSAVAGGHYHSCAVVNGGVRCWGGNQFGEIGNGSTTQSTTPAQVSGLTSGVTAVATGVHTCAVVNGGVQCWGLNASGQLGNGSTANSSVPAQVTGLTSGVTSLATGNSHSCAVVNGGVRCWGYNYDGELGNGSNTDSSVPVQVTGLTSGATVVAGGDKHGCAVVNGSVQCWGSNSFAQLGNGSYTDSNVPVQVSGLTSGVTTLAAGSWHSCAAVNGSVQCWGSNASGEFGNGNTNGNTTPTQVTGLTSGVTTVAGGYSHSCAVVNGGAQCWGSNDYGSLGNGSTTNSATPVQVTALTSGVGVMAMATGGGHSCAVVNGGVRCWGANNSGQLGNGSNTDSHVPVQVSGLASGVTAVATGMYHSCAVVNGGVRCWGSNGYGRLGNGSTTSSNVPVQVAGLTIGVTAVAVGDSHSCAVVNGGVQCWGRNGGRLGNGSTTSSTTPVQVTGLTSGAGVTAVAAGYGHSCAVVSGGVQCWGSGAYGRLGDGSTAGSITPVQVIGLTSGTGATAVATGDFHSCAVVNGGVRCWGDNHSGKLGNGSTTGSTTPVQVSGLTSGVTAVAVGNDHSCAVVNSAPVCWGYNGSGQLGNAASGPRTTPQRSLLFRRQTVPGVPTIGMTTGGNAHARLAPHPSLSQPSGNINGQVVVNSYSGKTGSFQENLSPSGLVMP